MNQVPILNNRKTKQLGADVESVMPTLPNFEASSLELLNNKSHLAFLKKVRDGAVEPEKLAKAREKLFEDWKRLARYLKAELRDLCPALKDWAEPTIVITENYSDWDDSIVLNITPDASWTHNGTDQIMLQFAIFRESLYKELLVPNVNLYIPDSDWKHADPLRSILKAPAGFVRTYDDGGEDEYCPFWKPLPLPLAEFQKPGAFDLERFVIAIRDAFEALAPLRSVIDAYLKKYPPVPPQPVPSLRKALILDLETWSQGKGDQRKTEAVEIGLIQVAYDSASGELSGELDRYEGLRDPGPKLKSGGVWGKVTPQMVKGQKLHNDKIEALIEPSEIIISHFNGADRAPFEALFPSSKDKTWLCSCNGLKWKASDMKRKKLEHLCARLDVINRDAHRAMPDAEALLNVLAQKDGAVSWFARLVGPTLQSD